MLCEADWQCVLTPARRGCLRLTRISNSGPAKRTCQKHEADNYMPPRRGPAAVAGAHNKSAASITPPPPPHPHPNTLDVA